MANNPTARFHRLTMLARQHREQRERAFPSFVLVHPVGVTSTPHTRFHRSCLGILSTRQTVHTRVSIVLSWAACRRCVQPALAFPSFFLGSHVGMASSPNSRFHLSFLGRLTRWQATRPRVSTASLCSHVTTTSSANARYIFSMRPHFSLLDLL